MEGGREVGRREGRTDGGREGRRERGREGEGGERDTHRQRTTGQLHQQAALKVKYSYTITLSHNKQNHLLQVQIDMEPHVLIGET